MICFGLGDRCVVFSLTQRESREKQRKAEVSGVDRVEEKLVGEYSFYPAEV